MPFHTEGSREDTYSAFFLIAKTLCFCFGLNSGLTFAAVIRHYYKRQLKGEKGLFSPTLPSSSALLRAAGAGNEGEATQNIAYWLACWLLPKPMVLQLSCTALVHLPRDGNVHIWLASPTPVINEGNVPQTPTAQSDLDSSSAEVSFSFAF